MINIPFSISLSFFLSAIFAAIVSKLGYRIVLLDNPNERSSHSHPTPRGGGAAGLLGLFEDRFTLTSKSRLIIQIGLSASVVYLFSGTQASKTLGAL